MIQIFEENRPTVTKFYMPSIQTFLVPLLSFFPFHIFMVGFMYVSCLCAYQMQPSINIRKAKSKKMGQKEHFLCLRYFIFFSLMIFIARLYIVYGHYHLFKDIFGIFQPIQNIAGIAGQNVGGSKMKNLFEIQQICFLT